MMHSLFDDDVPEEKTHLKEALRLLRLVVPTRTTFPALKSVKVCSDGSKVSMDATNLSTWIHVDSVDVHVPAGTYLVDFQKLRAGITIAQILEAECGDFPGYDFKGDQFPAGWVKELPRVAFAMSNDKTCMSLNGACVEASAVGATDGQRGVFLSVKTGAPYSFICKSETVLHLNAIKGSPEICRLSDTSIQVRYPWGFYAGGLEEGSYPNWRQIARKHHTHKIQISRSALISACSQILEASRKSEASQIHIHIERTKAQIIGILGGTAERLALGELPCVGGPSSTLVIRNNPRYLLEILRVLPGDTVTMGIETPTQSICMNPDSEDVYIQMPIRISA